MRIIVTGVPGCGKTTVATQLAAELEVPYLGKDQIKEALWDAIGPGGVEWSKALGGAASVALLHLTRVTHDAVVDHPVPSDHSEEWRELSDVVEVHIRCAPEVGRERYATRRRHPCHFDRERIADYALWLADDAKRAPLGPRLEVDSTNEVAVAPIAAWVRSR